jgi:hypothetical protein
LFADFSKSLVANLATSVGEKMRFAYIDCLSLCDYEHFVRGIGPIKRATLRDRFGMQRELSGSRTSILRGIALPMLRSMP